LLKRNSRQYERFKAKIFVKEKFKETDERFKAKIFVKEKFKAI